MKGFYRAGTPACFEPLQVDHACRMVSAAGASLPAFFTGLLLVYVFYYLLGWAPAPLGRLDIFAYAPPHVTGFYLIDSLIAGDLETFRATVAQLVLPALTLAIFSLAPIARMTRASMLAVLCDRVIVMRQGRIVEAGDTATAGRLHAGAAGGDPAPAGLSAQRDSQSARSSRMTRQSSAPKRRRSAGAKPRRA